MPLLALPPSRNSDEIILNYVSPDVRWCGVSKALVARLRGWAYEQGIERCTLLSSVTAREFYLSAGY
jgi:GNAT superfamily N-acetyltransferase